MAEDYYPNMGGGDGGMHGGDHGGEGEGMGREESDEPTALIPKSLLAGKEFKPGEEVVLKIVHIYEDEVEVEYAPEKPGEGEESYGDEIDRMSNENEMSPMKG